jgi:hypothetical protein
MPKENIKFEILNYV